MKIFVNIFMIALLILGKQCKCFALTSTCFSCANNGITGLDSSFKIKSKSQNVKDSVVEKKIYKTANNSKIIGDMVVLAITIAGGRRGYKAGLRNDFQGVELLGITTLVSGIGFGISYAGVKLVKALSK